MCNGTREARPVAAGGGVPGKWAVRKEARPASEPRAPLRAGAIAGGKRGQREALRFCSWRLLRDGLVG